MFILILTWVVTVATTPALPREIGEARLKPTPLHRAPWSIDSEPPISSGAECHFGPADLATIADLTVVPTARSQARHRHPDARVRTFVAARLFVYLSRPKHSSQSWSGSGWGLDASGVASADASHRHYQ